jgi:hypothetical protein
MNELLQAAGYAALVYLLFNYAISFGSGRPLTDAINPNRRLLPLFAVGLIGSAYSLLVQGSFHTGQSQGDILRALVSQEKAVPQAVGAVSFVVFALAVLLLWLWCWWNLPRDPKTFNPNPKDLSAEYRRVLSHYVQWKGGLDYAILCEVRDGVHTILAEGAADADIARGVSRLPAVGTAVFSLDPAKNVAAQKELWKSESKKMFDGLPGLDELVMPVRQGQNVTICFDVRYGAFYFEVLERPDMASGVWLYLFAASLNQHEVSTMTAGRHYYALAQAIRHVRSGVAKG